MAERYVRRQVQRSTRNLLLGFGGFASVVARRTAWRRAICCWMGRGVHCALLAIRDGRCEVKVRRPASCTCEAAMAKGRMLGAIVGGGAAERQRAGSERWREDG